MACPNQLQQMIALLFALEHVFSLCDEALSGISAVLAALLCLLVDRFIKGPKDFDGPEHARGGPARNLIAAG